MSGYKSHLVSLGRGIFWGGTDLRVGGQAVVPAGLDDGSHLIPAQVCGERVQGVDEEVKGKIFLRISVKL